MSAPFMPWEVMNVALRETGPGINLMLTLQVIRVGAVIWSLPFSARYPFPDTWFR